MKQITQKHRNLAICYCIAVLAFSSILPNADAASNSQKTCLWRIQSDNTTAYIQGSIHLLSKDAYPLPPQIEQAFATSDQVILEMDLAVMNDPMTQIEMLTKGMLPTGQTLTDILKPETIDLISKCSKNIGMNIIAFERYKPWMILMVLSATKLQSLGFSPENGIDFYFYKRAVSLNKKIVGLETMNEQLALFDNIVGKDQDAFVEQGLEDFMTIGDDIDSIIKAWRVGDLDKLNAILLKNMHKYPELHDILILNRNKNWMKTIEKTMKSGTTTMIIVGAGHLSGKGGLIQLLKNKNYKLEQL